MRALPDVNVLVALLDRSTSRMAAPMRGWTPMTRWAG